MSAVWKTSDQARSAWPGTGKSQRHASTIGVRVSRWRGVEDGQEAQPHGRDTRGGPSGGDLGQPVAVAEPIGRPAQLGGQPLGAVLRRARHRVEQLEGQQGGSAHEPGRPSPSARSAPSAGPRTRGRRDPPDPPDPVETRR